MNYGSRCPDCGDNISGTSATHRCNSIKVKPYLLGPSDPIIVHITNKLDFICDRLFELKRDHDIMFDWLERLPERENRFMEDTDETCETCKHHTIINCEEADNISINWCILHSKEVTSSDSAKGCNTWISKDPWIKKVVRPKGFHDVDEFYPDDDVGDIYSHDDIDEAYSENTCSPDTTGFRTCMRCYSLEETVEKLESRLDDSINHLYREKSYMNRQIDTILNRINSDPGRKDNYNRKNLDRIDELLDNIHENTVAVINPPGLIRQIVSDCNEIRDIIYLFKHEG